MDLELGINCLILVLKGYNDNPLFKFQLNPETKTESYNSFDGLGLRLFCFWWGGGEELIIINLGFCWFSKILKHCSMVEK